MVSSPIEALTLKQAKTDFERSFILEKLEENQWNISKTAEAIGIERSNLHRKIKAFEIETKKQQIALLDTQIQNIVLMGQLRDKTKNDINEEREMLEK